MQYNVNNNQLRELLYLFCALLGGLYFAWNGFGDYMNLQRLSTRAAITTSSLPLEGYTQEKTGRGPTDYVYSIKAKYRDTQGQLHGCLDYIEKPTLDQLLQKPIVKVRYLKNRPNVCMVEGARREEHGLLKGFAGLLVVLGVMGFGVYRLSLMQPI